VNTCNGPPTAEAEFVSNRPREHNSAPVTPSAGTLATVAAIYDAVLDEKLWPAALAKLPTYSMHRSRGCLRRATRPLKTKDEFEYTAKPLRLKDGRTVQTL